MRNAQVRHVRGPEFLRVQTAVMIPDGMHGYHDEGFRAGRGLGDVEHDYVLKSVVARLVDSGIPEGKARAMVARAHGRHHRRRALGHNGLGDDETVVAAPDRSVALAKISADAQSVENSHRNMIANMASWEERKPGWVTSDDDLRRTFQDQLTGLKDQFVQRSLPLLGVTFPYEIDRTDPAGAIVLAVRDDIQNTIDLLDARKAQQVLQKTISDLSKIPLPSAPPSINFSSDTPWWVWLGGAAVGAGMVYKTFIK